jgi:SAM-dependent methyltransferase
MSIDLFSSQSGLYASARPRYPEALFAFVASEAPGAGRAWDCGTGNGQAAVSLARHFTSVCATDPGAGQIAHATPAQGVAYSVQAAEAPGFPDGAFDAVCVAQALHWFDLPAFFAAARRVMKPGAVFAAWGYSWFTVSPAFDALFEALVREVIAPDWAPQNALLWRGYRDVRLPFPRIQSPAFQIREAWTLPQLLAYVRTWSAARRCIARIGAGFMERAAAELERVWGDPMVAREVTMPLFVLAGRRQAR